MFSHRKNTDLFKKSKIYYKKEKIIVLYEKKKILLCARVLMKNIYFCCRTSHEVRGLKYQYKKAKVEYQNVAPHTRCVD